MTPDYSFKNKTVFITGASRGIGLAIAKALASHGANIAIVAKTTTAHPTLPGTIYTAADECIKAGGKALGIQCDIRSETQIQEAVDKTVEVFGGIDILINNASAIALQDTQSLDVKRYDLMASVNARGTFVTTKICLPHLLESHRKGRNPHVLVLAPPPDLRPIWFERHVGYTIAKYGMSLAVIGFAGEFEDKIAVNGLWPLTSIETSAMKNVIDKEGWSKNRTVDIMADAAVCVLSQGVEYTGQFCIDEVVLRLQGETEFEKV